MFSEPAEKKIDELLARYPQQRSALLPILYVAQAENGYLSDDVMEYVAKRTGLTYLDVLSTASFYTMFYRQPVGQYVVQLCGNLSCWLMGSDHIEKCIERKLGIHMGETTPDWKFTFIEVECLGACGMAPAMQVNFDYHEFLTPEKVDKILDSLS